MEDIADLCELSGALETPDSRRFVHELLRISISVSSTPQNQPCMRIYVRTVRFD